MIYTVGHSNCPLAVFLGLLQAQGITQLVDVRTIPRSRFNPHFSQSALHPALHAAGICYVHRKELGGLRQPCTDSQNLGVADGFRGYADYMQTAMFEIALNELLALSVERPTVIMCAEAIPMECHRSLISDALVARAVPVMHLLKDGQVQAHTLRPEARIVQGAVCYPKREKDLFDAA